MLAGDTQPVYKVSDPNKLQNALWDNWHAIWDNYSLFACRHLNYNEIVNKGILGLVKVVY